MLSIDPTQIIDETLEDIVTDIIVEGGTDPFTPGNDTVDWNGEGAAFADSGDDMVQGSSGIDAIYGQGGNDTLYGNGSADYLVGGDGSDLIFGGTGSDFMIGSLATFILTGGVDTIFGGDGDDTAVLTNIEPFGSQERFAGYFDGGAGTDDLQLNGDADLYRIVQHLDTYKFYHQDHLDQDPMGRLIATATNIEKFEAQDLSSLNVESGFDVRAKSITSAAPSSLTALRDYDGNNLGNGSDWKLIGQADVQFDGDAEFIYVNAELGRWATVGPDETGAIDFNTHGQGGDTRVVGTYIDPEVAAGNTEKFSEFDSQQRFENDLRIDNLTVIDAFDFDNDGFQEVYFKVNDGTAYLRAVMHKDGNIQYANYQNSQQVTDYLTDLGYDQAVVDMILI